MGSAWHEGGLSDSLRLPRRLLNVEGIRSRHWDLSRNVERAKKASATVLEKWPAWRDAQVDETC